MNKEKIRQGLTLVELILAAALSVILAAGVISGYNFLFTQAKSGIDRGNLNLQIDYALEKIRAQCESASAVDIGSLFESGATSKKYSLCVTGEKDPYNIDISNSANKKKYCYQIDAGDVNDDGDVKDLILMDSDTSGGNKIVEVLIDSRYSPSVSFEYSMNSEPNYLTAAITAKVPNAGSPDTPAVLIKKEGIRFRYVIATK